MARFNWKTLAFTYGLSAAALSLPGTAHADWPPFDLYTVNGFGSHPTQALAVNAFAEIGGLAQPGNDPTVFNGLFGGAGFTSQISPIPNGWTSVQFSGINDSLYMIGTAYISGHPTAIGAQFGGNIVEMKPVQPNMGQSLALGVNHNGEVVGSYTQQTTSGIASHTFRWSSVSNSITKDWTGYLPGGINENGLIVAANLNPVNTFDQAELDFFPKTGPMTKTLAPGDYIYLYPSGISTYGGTTAIGLADLSQMNNSGTFLSSWAYNQAANQWTVLDGPGSPFLQSNANAVDVWGTKIVGSVLTPASQQVATVWQYVNGQWVANYLSDLIPSQPNWVFEAATGINTYGAISGYGLHKEGDRWVERGFVATPKLEFTCVFPEGGVYGGLTVSPTVHVQGLNPFAVDFRLTTSVPSIHIPRLVTMPGMADNATFEMDTDGVDVPTQATVTAQLGGLQFGKPVLLLPAVLQALTLRSSTDETGGTGIVSLHGKAGPSGVGVKLTSSDPTVLVPGTVSFLAGESTAPFRIALGQGAQKGKVVTITATYANRSVSQQFTIN